MSFEWKNLKYMLLTALLLAVKPSFAQTYTTVSPSELVNILREAGYTPEIKAGTANRPETLRVAVEGITTTVTFYNCDAGSCRSFQYYASWTVHGKTGVEVVNTWNAKHRFGRAYLDSDRDPTIEMDVDLDGGVNLKHIKESIETWRVIATNFRTALSQD